MSESGRAPMQWMLRLLLTLPLTLAFQIRIGPLLPFTGDEPHYMLGAHSFVYDGDFDVLNNYLRQDNRRFGYHERLDSPFRTPSTKVLPTEHGFGFPLVISAPYAIGGIKAVRWFLMLTALLTILLVALICDLTPLPGWVGTAAALLLTFSPTWQIFATRIYPECFAGFVFCLIMAALLGALRLTGWRRQATLNFAALMIVLLPVMYIKYVSVCAALLAIAMLKPEFRTRALLAGLLCGVAAAVGASILFRLPGQGVGGEFMFKSSFFSIAGAFNRFWPSLLDRWHGLFVLQPVMFLMLWAMIFYLADWRRILTNPPAWLALSALCFTGMVAVFTSTPGWSLPGRYDCSLLPLLAILVAAWALRDAPLRTVRLGLLLVLSSVGAYYVIRSVAAGIAPYQLPLPVRMLFVGDYKELYSYYWEGMEIGPIVKVGWAGAAIWAMVLASKADAILLTRNAPRWRAWGMLLAAALALVLPGWLLFGRLEHVTAEVNRPLRSFEQVLTSPVKNLQLQALEKTTIPVNIRNPGWETWASAGRCPIVVGTKWYTGGQMLDIEGTRTALPGVVRPKSAVDVQVNVEAPSQRGDFRLRITLVQEGAAWFMSVSGRYLEIPVSVH